MKGLFFTFFFVVCVLAVGMMMLGMCEDPAKSEIVIIPTPVPLTEDEQQVEGAHSRGATLFQYNGDGEDMALCDGQARLVGLGGDMKEIRLTAQEAANLSLCKQDPATGNYYTVQEIAGTEPGDSLVWGEDGGLHDTKYTPQ